MKTTPILLLALLLLVGCTRPQPDAKIAQLLSTLETHRGEIEALKAELAALRGAPATSRPDGLAREVAALKADAAAQKKALNELFEITKQYLAKDALEKIANMKPR